MRRRGCSSANKGRNYVPLELGSPPPEYLGLRSVVLRELLGGDRDPSPVGLEDAVLDQGGSPAESSKPLKVGPELCAWLDLPEVVEEQLLDSWFLGGLLGLRVVLLGARAYFNLRSSVALCRSPSAPSIVSTAPASENFRP